MPEVVLSSSPCPKCSSAKVHRLDFASENAWMDYHRCAACGHVWTEPRPNALARWQPPGDSASDRH
jgi:hypothetical protein